MKKLFSEIEESKKNGTVRNILNHLWQIIEDIRINANENYSYRGDLQYIGHVQNYCFSETKNHYNELVEKNPFALIMEALRSECMSNFHELFFRSETLEIPNKFKPYYEKAMDILNDGRLKEALKQGKESCHVTLELAKEIEKEWAVEFDQSEGSESSEGSSESGENSDDISKLNDKFNKDQGNYEISSDPFSNFVNELCDKVEKMMEEEEKELKHQEKYISKRDLYISYGIDDKIIIAEPNSNSFKNVKNKINSSITHVRDKIAIHLKSISDKNELHGLRRGQLDYNRIYQTALGCKNVMKKTYPKLDYDTAVQIVIDLSGSMGYGTPSRSVMSMEMAIILAEVFQLLRIPFEITGFNTGNRSYSNPEYKGAKNVIIRKEQINFHIFKAFSDDYSLDNIKHRLGSISPSGANIDHEVIAWSAARLAKMKEKRKLQIVLSDGQPNGSDGTYYGLLDKELKNTNKRIEKAKISQFAFGLQSDCVKEYYKNYVVINDMTELKTKALEVFVKFLMEGIPRRVFSC